MKLFSNFLLLSLATLSLAKEELSADQRREQLRKEGGRKLQGGDNGSDGGTGGDGGGAPPPVDICFSAMTTVEVQGKGFISMSAVEIGDLVRAGNEKFSPIIGFGKRDHEKVGQYYQLVSDLEEPLELSQEHMVFVSGVAKPASEVRIGDMLGEHEITEINQVLRKGAYAPMTQSGDIVVSGALASCYTAFLDFSLFDRHASFHAFFAPFRAGLISNWSNDKDRANWVVDWAYYLHRFKYSASPTTQYLTSFVAVPAYSFAMLIWMYQNFGLLLNLAIAGTVVYRAVKHNSKVKNA